MGKSSRLEADREQPVGERRMWKICEAVPELRTETTVGCDGSAPVIVLE